MKWTKEREDVLLENASLGLNAVCEALKSTGANPTTNAVKKQASRMGISLMKNQTCPQCGGRFRELHEDGLCNLCHIRRLRDSYNIKSLDHSQANSVIQARREYDRKRKQKTPCVFSVNLSREMSPACSEGIYARLKFSDIPTKDKILYSSLCVGYLLIVLILMLIIY